MTVSFIIAGVQKGGTTSLHLWLDQHPGLALAPLKELHFFDEDEAFANGAAPYAEYEAQFPADRPPGLPRGEATPSYIWWPGAMERIAAYNPAMKLIFLLRCPIERAWSHWRMSRKRKRESLPFIEAIEAEPERLRTGAPADRRALSYVSRGMYAAQIRKARALFPERQLLFLKSEALRAAPGPALEQVCRFLSVAPHDFDTSEEWHVGPDLGPMPEEARGRLRAIYAPDVREVEQLLGWDCGAWLR